MKIKNYLMIVSIVSATSLLPACVDETGYTPVNENMPANGNMPAADISPPLAANNNNNYYASQRVAHHITHNNNQQIAAHKKVQVPASALLANNHPQSHHDVDKNWVSAQKPQGYTIELIRDEKAASVATTLYNAPKNERSAEIKSSNDGKSTYTGVYGSYENKQAAEKALQKLPPELRKNANVTQWENVQRQAAVQPTANKATNNTTMSDNSKNDGAKSE